MIPSFSPMLAVRAEPFDSPDHLFEVKWDGVRALACVEQGRWRMWGREPADYAHRYPELEGLCRLPSGTLVDGELAVLRGGRADLNAILRRHALTSPLKITLASRQSPVTYILFDLLYYRGRPLLDEPLSQRRTLLQGLLEQSPDPRLAFSEGMLGAGQEFFEKVVAEGHEGIMAKHLASCYLPGRRVSAWRKIKPHLVIPCVIIGYTPGRQEFQSLLVAAPWQGRLEYAGRLTCGWTRAQKAQLAPLLASRIRAHSVVPCPKKARWVELDLYCRVQFLQRTPRGRLRGASFRGLIDGLT